MISNSLQQLSQDHAEFLDKRFTTMEILDTIKHIKNNKAPGTDRFTAEFYKTFKLDLINHMIDAFNNVLETGKVPKSWLESSIILIPKENKDNLDPALYQPITLMNYDAKIFAKTLTNRLSKIITNYGIYILTKQGLYLIDK